MAETKLAPSELVDDYDQILRVVQLYIDGAARGDAQKLREAFVDGAWMHGHVDGRRMDMPIEKLIERTAGHPADVDGRYRARVTSVQQVGDAAIATVAEDGFWGRVSFVDFFSLVRMDGVWKIANKTFAHTGGEMPG